MSLNRRTFVERALAAGAGTVAGAYVSADAQQAMKPMHEHPAGGNNGEKMPHPALNTAKPQLNALSLAGHVDPLPLPEVLRAADHGHRLNVTMRATKMKLHRDLPAATVWSYAAGDGRHGAVSQAPIAPLLEMRKGQPVEVEWIHQLPHKHIFPIDRSLHGCGPDNPDVRAIAHMHGARTHSQDDGYPEDWFTYGRSRVCRYPLEQDATALWYHDHAMGINRLNVYAGMIGMALIRDEQEDALQLPSGRYELPLILYDRMLDTDGQLLYPDSGDPEHPWVSEFVGDALCVNGVIRPYIEVEPTVYRLRVLNAANSRFYNVTLTDDRPFQQIGSDQGLLAAPLQRTHVALAPSERADLLVDLSALAGRKIYLQTGMQTLLEFRIGQHTSAPVRPPLPAKLRIIERLDQKSAVLTRRLTLHDYQNKAEQSMLMLINRKAWHEPTTEKPKLHTTEIWEFVNLTEDTHPMHLHLVRFQVIDRRPFEPYDFIIDKKITFNGPLEQPLPNEMGWKDVVQCPAGMITRIIVHFDGYPGKYLYHCHILEHESNDMMRPFEVVV